MSKRLVKNSKAAFLLAGMLSAAMISCRKESPTLARILVVDENGMAFPNAKVHLYPTPTIPPPHGAIVIDDILYTDAEGYVIFDYSDNYNLGQAGFAVLNIEVMSDDELLYGEGIIKIEEEKLNEETVIIQQ